MPNILSRHWGKTNEYNTSPQQPFLFFRIFRFSRTLCLVGITCLAPALSGCAESVFPRTPSALPQTLSGTSDHRLKREWTSPWIELKSDYPADKAWKIVKKTVDWRLEYPVTLESRDYFVTAWRNGVRIYAIIDRREPFDALLKLESVRPVYPKDIEMQVREILWKALGEDKHESEGG